MIEHLVQGAAVSPPVSEQLARASPSSSGCDLSDHESHSDRSVPSSSSPTADDNLGLYDGPRFTSSNSVSSRMQKNINISCSNCHSPETIPVARCLDCCSNMCDQCEKAHNYAFCFKNHRTVPISSCQQQPNSDERLKVLASKLACPMHSSMSADFFCRSCSVPACAECVQSMHSHGHDCTYLEDEARRSIHTLNQMSKRALARMSEATLEIGNVEYAAKMLPTMYSTALTKVEEVYQQCLSVLNDAKMKVVEDLQTTYSRQLTHFGLSVQQAKETVERLRASVDKIDQLLSESSPVEVMMNRVALSKHLDGVAAYTLDVQASECGIGLQLMNEAATALALRSAFGQVGTGSQCASESGRLSAIDRAIASSLSRQANSSSPQFKSSEQDFPTSRLTNSYLDQSAIGVRRGSHPLASFDHNLGNVSSSSSPFTMLCDDTSSQLFRNPLVPEESVMDALSTSIAMSVLSSDATDVTSQFGGYWTNPDDQSTRANVNTTQSNYGPIGSVRLPEPVNAVSSMMTMSSTNSGSQQPKSQVKRMKMMYQCKFGEYGVSEAQFTEPSGVSINAAGDVVVADTNNHRIQVFDVEGRFKYQFGECGKRDGQLLYPNRIAVMRQTNDIVITERSPTHQVQIYTQYGQFVRKFGSNILQHPRGIAVDRKGRIVIVECKVMRVIVFGYMGNVISMFCCAKYLQFPNGIAVNDNEEIFISDNHAHCVKVFSYTGQYLRQVGGEGITNYPVGVVVNPAGEVIVADNHNNFNLTVFSPEGQLLGAFESKVKHAQCFDIALIENRSVALATKDYRVYIYKLPNF